VAGEKERDASRRAFSSWTLTEDNKKPKQAKLFASVAAQGPDYAERSAAPACDGDLSSNRWDACTWYSAVRSNRCGGGSCRCFSLCRGYWGGLSTGDVAAVPSSSATSIGAELGQEAAAVFKIHYTRALLKSASEGLAKVVQQDLLMSSGRGEGAARAASR